MQGGEEGGFAVIAAVGGIFRHGGQGQNVHLHHGEWEGQFRRQTAGVSQLKGGLKGGAGVIGAHVTAAIPGAPEEKRGIGPPGKGDGGPGVGREKGRERHNFTSVPVSISEKDASVKGGDVYNLFISY